MTRRRDVIVGVVIVFGVIVGVLGTVWLQGTNIGRDTKTVDALFSEVGMLMRGNTVKLRGVTIGRVEEITVEPSGEAVRVTLRVDGQVAFPSDAVVILAPESFFGDWQAEVVSRSRYSRFPYMEVSEPGVLSGHALPDITRLTAAALEISDNLTVLTDRVELAFTEETALNLASAIDNIGVVSQQLADLVENQAAGFTGVITELQGTADEVGGAARAVRQSFERADEILESGSIESILASGQQASENIRVMTQDLSSVSSELESTLNQIDTAFSRFNRLAARIEAGEGAFGALMNDTILVAQAHTVMSQFSILLQDLRDNPQRYVRLSIF
jgi:phospholipid/cholesterol/gamma-HCH transport system substrate-binding protein